MGILCDCLTLKTEGKIILVNNANKSNEYTRPFTGSLKGNNPDSCSTVNNSSRYSLLLECEKKKYDEQDERHEVFSNRLFLGKNQGFNRSGIFQEDTEVSNSNKNKFKLSKEKRKNKRLILTTTSKEISSLLFINDDEILLSYDIIDILNDNELIYKGPAVQINNEQQRLAVIIKLFKHYIQINYNDNSNSDNKPYEIYFDDVISVSKMLYKRDYNSMKAKHEKNIVFIFQINTCNFYYEFGCNNYGIGNSLFKAIQFLQFKT